MGLTMKEKRSVAGEMAAGYQRARKKEKGIILGQFVELTGYVRRYAARLLCQHGKKIRVGATTIIGDVCKRPARDRQPVYDGEVVEALRKIWMTLDCICGKRLKAALADVIPMLKKNMEIQLKPATEEKLLAISASTIDRLLSTDRKKHALKGRSGTKPGTLLKHQIKIRTFSEWNEQKPGFVEIDLVGHDGGDGSGEFCQTLDVTDVCTAWTETRAVQNKAQIWVFNALTDIRKALPFQLLGIDSDNGGEFINHELYRYCLREQITFTRARPTRKNDSCFVEEKNYSIVRRNVGYRRYDSPKELAVLNELYGYLRLYTNFFLPTMKLVSKERIGSRVKKIYGEPTTPYKRVLASPDVKKADKDRLRKTYSTLNPAQLKREITGLQEKLLKIGVLKEQQRRDKQPGRSNKVSRTIDRAQSEPRSPSRSR